MHSIMITWFLKNTFTSSFLFLGIFLAILGGAPCLVYAKPPSLPLPRFVSLRAKTANLHVGPGKEYPSKWRYVLSGLPMEIVAEFDTWRKVRDPDGVTEGWIHKSLLCNKRTVMIQKKQCTLYDKPHEKSSVVALINPQVIGRVLECPGEWCRLDVKGYRGWVRREDIWGVYAAEIKFK